MTWLRRLGAVIVLLIGGVALGTAGIVVQANRSILAGHDVPWGLALTLLALAAGVRGACWWARSRAAGVVVAAGWILATVVLAAENAAGDILLPDDLRSQVYLFGGIALAALSSVVPLPTRELERPRPAHAARPSPLEPPEQAALPGSPPPTHP
ncbi:MAG: DUF6113 family protein [Candidatus Nanopelagicales bacterium]